MTYLNANHITFKYFKQARENILEDVSLCFKKNKTTIIIGNSGCGKSTLLSVMAGLLPENGGFLAHGCCTIDGNNIHTLSLKERVSYIGAMFQNPDLQFCMNTLYKEMIFCLENISTTPYKMDEIIHSFVSEYNLEELLHKNFDVMSGGEKQKCALCCLLLLGSECILLDEPFSNIDPTGTKNIISILKKHKEKHPLTIVAVDHKLENWLEIADEVTILSEKGKVIADNIPIEKIADYRNIFYEQGLFYPYDSCEFVGKNLEVNPSALNIKNLCVSTKDTKILNNTNAEFEMGRLTAILGESGCGKTTLFHTILKQNKYTGEIKLFDVDLKKIKHKSLYKDVSIIFQNPANQFITQNVLDEIKYSLKYCNQKLSDDETEKRALELLDSYKLRKYAKYSPFMLSQGQQRRLAVLTAIASDSKLLLVDEPTYGQDMVNSTEIMNNLKSLCDERNMTIIFTTHDISTANRYADYIYDMQKGGALSCRK